LLFSQKNILKKIIKILFLLFSIFFHTTIYAQREANVWYFGNNAGVDFNSGVPIPLIDGHISRWEGVATFCDSLGNLLFYTDGDSVWNSQHIMMPGGFDLLGHPSSTESAIIVPLPNNDSLYFLMTVDEEGGVDGVCYNIINMKLNNGLGAIIEKNIPLIAPTVEKLTAVRHQNNRDFWVITHGWETDSFFVYLVTPEGIQMPPQIFEIGTRHEDIGISGNNAVGYMRVSPYGNKIALALQVNLIFELFDFNNLTGEISNHIIINDLGGSPYGVEFSADGTKLYMTSFMHLYQADVTSNDEITINNSVTLIGSSNTNNFFGALQLATDGKIYLAQEFSPYLGVINNPSNNGIECNFDLNGFWLEGKQSRLGLPNFIQSYFIPPDFRTTYTCFGDSTQFIINDITGIDSVIWNFGDEFSNNNESKLFSPKHLYTNADNYNVKLTIWKNEISYLKNQIIKLNSSPIINLPDETTFCFGDSILLDAYSLNCNFLWSNNSTDSAIWVFEVGQYYINVVNKYTLCSASDTIQVRVLDLPNFSLGDDFGFCKKDTAQLCISYPNATFLWNTNQTDSCILITNEGEYILRVTNNLLCKNYDTINIIEYQPTEFSIGNDTVICPETDINLQLNINGNYLWSDSSIINNFNINQAGIYWLKFSNLNNCVSYDTIYIFERFLPEINLGNDTLLCEGENITLQSNCIDCYSFLWNDNSTLNFQNIYEKGNYSVKVTNICGDAKDSIIVSYKYCGEVSIPNIFTPNEDGTNEYFYIKGIETGIWNLFIYNRWGNLIYNSSEYKNNWNGDNCPSGTYYYILQNNSNEIQFTGFVYIYKE